MLELSPGDTAAWVALAWTVMTTAVLGIRAIVGGRASKRQELERDEKAQASSVSVWVEDRGGAPPDVVLFNGSTDPIKFVAVIVSRLGALSELPDAVNYETLTFAAVGPGQAVRKDVRISSVWGVVRADASVMFVDKNGQGWHRSVGQQLTKADYGPREFQQFDTTVRDTDQDDQRSPAAGRRVYSNGRGSSLSVALGPDATIRESHVKYTATSKGRERVTFQLSDEGEVLAVDLLNVPPRFITDPPHGHWTDDSLAVGPEGSAVFPFFAPELMDAAMESHAYNLTVRRSPSDDIGLGHVSYDTADNPIAVFIYNAAEQLPSFSADEGAD